MKTRCTLALLLCVAVLLGLSRNAEAADPYISLGLGYAGEEFNASTTGVNHPTRCDSLLYPNAENAPTDAACTASTARPLIDEMFELDAGHFGTASVGFATGQMRVEVELLGRSHAGVTVPAIAGVDNAALIGKSPEWSPHLAPRYGVSDFSSHQLTANAYYTLSIGSAWQPFVGIGVGVARIEMDYSGSYLRRTVAEGYVAAVEGDPSQPLAWHLAAAGTVSQLNVEVSDWTPGFQLLAGLERNLNAQVTAFVVTRWVRFAEIDSTDLWATVRSHAPVQADGITPFQTVQSFDGIGGFGVSAGLRYAF